MKMTLQALLAIVAVGGAGIAPAQVNLSIVTGGTGGVYYPIGGGMGRLLSKALPGWQVTAEVTGGAIDNVKLIHSKPTGNIGFLTADAAHDGLNGLDKLKDFKAPLRTLFVMYPNRMHLVSFEGSKVARMQDLKGKHIASGSPGSATEVMALRIMEAYGIGANDARRERLSVAESVNAMKDRKIEAFWWMGGLPTAAVADFASTPGVKIKLIDHADAAAAMNKKYGAVYAPGLIPAKSYAGQEQDSKIVLQWNIAVAHANLTEAQAYAIVKAVFDNAADMRAVHKEADFKLENQNNVNTPLPYHPGAAKFFAEKGLKLN